SKVLNMDTSFAAILPQDSRKHRGVEPLRSGIKPSERPKTLILLHGLSDNWNAWAHRTSILRYAEDFDIAVLIPEVQRSFYMDMKNGPAYNEYIAEELPELAEKMFNISVAAEDLMIAGLSMGGYGALQCALSRPERYYGVGAFSSVANLRRFVMDDDFASRQELSGWIKDRTGIFGENIKYPEDKDLFNLADGAEKCAKTPRIFMTCGTEDFMYADNCMLRDHLISKSFDFRYEEWEGTHEWGFWDRSVQIMLEHFLLKNI
ncbi:MAG: alpha/beta hydrolase-fold protein, partial [Oscillospiraceae bacterium]